VTGTGGAGADRLTGLPLRVAVIIPSPRDAVAFDAEAAWQDLANALKSLEAQGLVAVDRVVPATEQSLKQRLAASPCHVLHFIGHASWRAAARYGTLTLENSSRGARSITTPYLGTLLSQHQTLQLTVLQPCARDSAFDASPAALWDRGPSVIVSEGTLRGRPQAVFAARLYASLATGSTMQEAASHAHGALADIASDASLLLKSGSPGARLVDVTPAAAVSAVGASLRTAVDAHTMDAAADAAARAAAAELAAERLATKRELDRKRAGSEFDVFLCHNGADKPSVRRIADLLEERGLLPWLDERELPPGQPWQQLLEKQIGSIRTAAVFVGAAGIGPWQQQELDGFLREFKKRNSPVIPVLLPDAPDNVELPIFLNAMTWVDFRLKDPDPLTRLIWGITRQRPRG
jgi:TIR domain